MSTRTWLTRLHIKHYAYVRSVVRTLGVSESDADDTTQRVFWTAYRRVCTIEADRERAFLRAIARREASHTRRSYQRRGELTTDNQTLVTPQSVQPDELTSRKQALNSFEAAMKELDTELRGVLQLCEFDGLSTEQASRLLAVPHGTVKSRLRRAREQLERRTRALRHPR